MLGHGMNLHSFVDEAAAQVSSTQHRCALCGSHVRRQPEMNSTDWTDREDLWQSGTLRGGLFCLFYFLCAFLNFKLCT